MDVDNDEIKSPTKEVLPEVDSYLAVLVQIFLYDKKEIKKGVQFSTGLIERLRVLNRRTLDSLAARVYFYYSNFFEQIAPLPTSPAAMVTEAMVAEYVKWSWDTIIIVPPWSQPTPSKGLRLRSDAPDQRLQMCFSVGLYEGVFEVYKKVNNYINTVNVLVENIVSIERAQEFAERVEFPDAWRRVVKAQLYGLRVSVSIESYIHAHDSSNYNEVIETATLADKDEESVKYLKTRRINGCVL
ncbi:hypothetical protein BJY04DRAFT_219613 [Aspergillus karnatakaensis]|uniref:uncharacterized protein n=1 Tax=Aspergillus karnatakaensis TaxID=1810916 RepID=UPI003CCD683F